MPKKLPEKLPEKLSGEEKIAEKIAGKIAGKKLSEICGGSPGAPEPIFDTEFAPRIPFPRSRPPKLSPGARRPWQREAVAQTLLKAAPRPADRSPQTEARGAKPPAISTISVSGESLRAWRAARHPGNTPLRTQHQCNLKAGVLNRRGGQPPSRAHL